MCDPLSIIGAAATLGSAAISGVAASNQADAQRQAANYNAQVQSNNALIAGYQRSAALQNGQAEAEQAQLQSAQLVGQQRAALAANGVDINSGSASDQLASTRFLSGQDINNIQANAAWAAWGYQTESTNAQAQSNLDKWQANQTNPAAIGALASGSSLLSTASAYALRKLNV